MRRGIISLGSSFVVILFHFPGDMEEQRRLAEEMTAQLQEKQRQARN